MCQSRNEGFDRSPNGSIKPKKEWGSRWEKKEDLRLYVHGCGMFMQPVSQGKDTRGAKLHE